MARNVPKSNSKSVLESLRTFCVYSGQSLWNSGLHGIVKIARCLFKSVAHHALDFVPQNHIVHQVDGHFYRNLYNFRIICLSRKKKTKKTCDFNCNLSYNLRCVCDSRRDKPTRDEREEESNGIQEITDHRSRADRLDLWKNPAEKPEGQSELANCAVVSLCVFFSSASSRLFSSIATTANTEYPSTRHRVRVSPVFAHEIDRSVADN